MVSLLSRQMSHGTPLTRNLSFGATFNLTLGQASAPKARNYHLHVELAAAPMIHPHRYIPPIYVDLNVSATPSKDKELSVQPLSAPLTTKFMPSSTSDSEPRPSHANSLLLNLLDFPLAAVDSDPERSLKCEFGSVLEVGDGHDTPAKAHYRIFPLPYGQDDTLDLNGAMMKQRQDPLVVEKGSTSPTAVFTRTTISASPAVTVQRGGRTSQFSAKQRRERHNANERRRTNAAKDRVRDMRDRVASLERHRAELTAQRDATATANDTLVHRRPLQDVMPRESVDNQLGYCIPSRSTYVDLVKYVDELRHEKRYLADQLDQLDSRNSALQALQAELSAEITSSQVAIGTTTSRKRKRVDSHVLYSKRVALAKHELAGSAGGYALETETVPSFLKVLFSEPMTSDAAFNWVKDSYSHIMAQKALQKPSDSDGTSILGWRQDRCEISKSKESDDENSLELMISQAFSGIISSELVFTTWTILTLLGTFQQLFPLTKDLAVLQTINDDCVVVRVGIAPTHGAAVVHSIVVLARGQIDGGYLISMRSVPLSPGQKAFAVGEGTYLPVLAWFMLLDTYDDNAQPMCEVIVGASTQHKSQRVLRRLATEFVAGAVRWQVAIGQNDNWLL